MKQIIVIHKMLLLFAIGCTLFSSVKSGGLYDDLGGGNNNGGGLNARPDHHGLYDQPSLLNAAEVGHGEEGEYVKGPNYPPTSAIGEFEVGYGGTYYRKGQQQAGKFEGGGGGNSEGYSASKGGPDSGHKPNSNHISYGTSGSSFDKPLDEYSSKHQQKPLNLNTLTAVQLHQLRALVEAATAVKHGQGRREAKPNVLAYHDTLGPLLPRDQYGGGGRGAASSSSYSYSPLNLEYGAPLNSAPGDGLETLQKVLDAQMKLNALKSDILSKSLTKLHQQLGNSGGSGYGLPTNGGAGSSSYGPGGGYSNGPELGLHPIFGMLENVDSSLIQKLLNKELQLANLEREKNALISAAGKAALGSIREKGKLVQLYSQLGIASSLKKSIGSLHHNNNGPASGSYGPVPVPEYNANFAPVPVNKIHLNPVRPVEYGPPNNPPPLPSSGGGGGFPNGGYSAGGASQGNGGGYSGGGNAGQGGGYSSGNVGGHNVEGGNGPSSGYSEFGGGNGGQNGGGYSSFGGNGPNGGGGYSGGNGGNGGYSGGPIGSYSENHGRVDFGRTGDAFGSPSAVQEVLMIHPIYPQQPSIKQMHNIYVQQELNGQHYYGPAPGPDFPKSNSN